MRKILMGVLTIAVVGGLIGAGVVAYFTDTESILENRFEAGTIDLDIWPTVDGTGTVTPVMLEKMKPCDWEYYKFFLHNAGNNEGPVYLHFDVTDWGDGDNPESELPGANDIHNWITVDVKVGGLVIISPDDHVKLGWLDCKWICLGWLGETSSVMEVELSFHLQAETDNHYQGDWCTFDIEAMMTDHNSPPPGDGNAMILEDKDPSTWEPIPNDTWGFAMYHASDLKLFVYAQGLTATTDYQVSINSPEKVDWYPLTDVERKSMASALASGDYNSTPQAAPPTGWNLFERGYSSGGLLHGAYVEGDTGCFTTSKDGETPLTITTDANGKFAVWLDFPLDDGDYKYIKVLVKEDFSPWDAVLMEKDTTMAFTIS